MRTRGFVLLAALVLATTCLAASAGSAHAWAGGRLVVAPWGSNSAACTWAHPCRTISHAVQAAAPGETVIVRRGRYHEMVTVTKRVTIVGLHRPLVNAAGKDNGFLITGGGSGSTIAGFRVRNATEEGILVAGASHVRILWNAVSHNDLGMFSSTPTGECAPQGEVPGDCGEGIHLMSSRHSRVAHNVVFDNAGGILLTDEFGPTAWNAVVGNRVFHNQYDCGITIAAHNPGAVMNGVPQPNVAGIYRNWIVGNVSNDNGRLGEGAGILLAAGAPTGGVYSNWVLGNHAARNELAGITVHEHAPGGDLNGNVFIGNRLRHNGLGGTAVPPGDPDAGVTQTVDLLVFSAVDTITGTVIRHNHLSYAHFGIWTQNVAGVHRDHNTFFHVAVPIHRQ